ncbi:hypothetical protein EDEG_01683 [Edhazardia aedis USNM 41457]|uniref:Uncharacterized protein n=1 Tax=Edhazardia aedis (strain USNM 41457) TaxID=1003232 RepID=J9D999_EDHAE|nr:hypothetical protein EDEG_01683 [Edhazardia aedis USNM 41457]|eukprot:EJW04049.1 hypothetical protein EDEG_01683 [Edhazardia aedis USNM 41457]
MKRFTVPCVILFIASLIIKIILFYTVFHYSNVHRGCEYYSNDIVSQKDFLSQNPNLHDDCTEIFMENGEEHCLTSKSPFNVNPSGLRYTFTLYYNKTMKKGTDEDCKILSQKKFQFSEGEYENQGTIFYNISPSKVWYNMTEFTPSSKKIKCIPIKFALLKFKKPIEKIEKQKLNILGIKSHPEDVLIDQNGCFGNVLFSKFEDLQTIKNCFDSNGEGISRTYSGNNMSNPSKDDNKKQINDNFLVHNIIDHEYYEQSKLLPIERGSPLYEFTKTSYTCSELLENSKSIEPKYNYTLIIDPSYDKTSWYVTKIGLHTYFTYLNKLKKMFWKTNPCFIEILNNLRLQYISDCQKQVLYPLTKKNLENDIIDNIIYCCSLTAKFYSIYNLNIVKSEKNYFPRPSPESYDHCASRVNPKFSSSCIHLAVKKMNKNFYYSMGMDEFDVVSVFSEPYECKSDEEHDYYERNTYVSDIFRNFQLCSYTDEEK